MNNLKHAKEEYENCVLDEPSSEVKSHTQKLVKCRSEHECVSCGELIEKGDYAVFEKAFAEGEWGSCYTCINCADEQIEVGNA